MAAGDTVITIVGNLVDDPELRFTPTGQAVARFRVASTPRFMDRQSNEWKDGDSLFLTCNVWRQPGENAAESLTRGMRVILQGRLRQRSYETKEGDKRTVYEVEVDEIGPSLRHATAKVTKFRRNRPNTPPQENPWDGMPTEGQEAPAEGTPAMATAGAAGDQPDF
ncbi:single-stranded DNA-binding protein [Nonomuraea cavernae]|nr:single-stranded DNA-binding protein [Nonomuraea cavernae]MCA2190640.1 single-stranded DNA-binding protein [Nonomuraea cavernae]